MIKYAVLELKMKTRKMLWSIKTVILNRTLQKGEIYMSTNKIKLLFVDQNNPLFLHN